MNPVDLITVVRKSRPRVLGGERFAMPLFQSNAAAVQARARRLYPCSSVLSVLTDLGIQSLDKS